MTDEASRCCTVLYCAVLYCTVLYSTVLCCTVLNLYCELYFRAYGSFPDRLYVVYQGNIVYQVGAQIRILNSAMLSVEDEWGVYNIEYDMKLGLSLAGRCWPCGLQHQGIGNLAGKLLQQLRRNIKSSNGYSIVNIIIFLNTKMTTSHKWQYLSVKCLMGLINKGNKLALLWGEAQLCLPYGPKITYN